jgi:hypothetical protein
VSAGGTVTMPYQTTFWADGLRHVHRQVRHTVDGQCRQPEVLEDALDDLRLQDRRDDLQLTADDFERATCCS